MFEMSGAIWLWGVSLLAGGVLGALFFGGLWWSLQRGAVSPHPTRWFIGSFIVRTVIVLAGFYAVGAGQPLRLMLSLLGFVLARAIVLRLTRVDTTVQTLTVQTATVQTATAQAPTPQHTPGEPPCA